MKNIHNKTKTTKNRRGAPFSYHYQSADICMYNILFLRVRCQTASVVTIRRKRLLLRAWYSNARLGKRTSLFVLQTVLYIFMLLLLSASCICYVKLSFKNSYHIRCCAQAFLMGYNYKTLSREFLKLVSRKVLHLCCPKKHDYLTEKCEMGCRRYPEDILIVYLKNVL